MNEILLGAGCALVLALTIRVWTKRRQPAATAPTPSPSPGWMKPGTSSTTKVVVSSGDLSNVADLLSKLQGFAGADPHMAPAPVLLDGLDELIRTGQREEAIRLLQTQFQLPEALAVSVVDQVTKAMGR